MGDVTPTTSGPAILVRCGAIALSVIAMAMSTCLLVVSQTPAGFLFGAGGLLFGVVVIAICLAFERHSRKAWLMAGISFSGWIVATLWLGTHAPDGLPSSHSRVQNRFVNGHWGFQRFALGNLLPERDQLALGFKIMPFQDSLLTMKQSKRLLGWTSHIYDELEADPGFHALGSAMPGAYDELWNLPFNHGHYYLYVPPKLDRQVPQPGLVFLHGSGGNFKAYTWLLSKVADQMGMILISPSYGMGNWHEPDTSRLIQSVIDDASKAVSLDARQIHLMGLSNGGLGVSEAGETLESKFRTLTFLSPVFDKSSISSPQFAKHWQGRPVLVITGSEDDRVPLNYVTENVAMMSAADIHVTFKTVSEADHFMLFSHWDTVFPLITGWLKQHMTAGPAVGPSPLPVSANKNF